MRSFRKTVSGAWENADWTVKEKTRKEAVAVRARDVVSIIR
jgi:hypothetical protein